VDGRRTFQKGRATGELSKILLYPFADFTYHLRERMGEKSFFVAGQRIATRSRSWVAPAAAGPVFGATAGRATTAGAGALVILALVRGRRRPRIALRIPQLAAPSSRFAASASLVVILSVPPGLAGQALADPLRLGGSDDPLLIYVRDHLGSTRVVLDANGDVVATADYTPFGETLRPTGTRLRSGFTGQESDAATGLLHYGARDYHPTLSRFTSADPAVQSFDSQGLHPFAYVLNQPTHLVDPDGRLALAIGVVAATLAGGLSLGLAAGLVADDEVTAFAISALALVAVTAAFLALTPTTGAVIAFTVALGLAFTIAEFGVRLAKLVTGSSRSVTIETEQAQGIAPLGGSAGLRRLRGQRVASASSAAFRTWQAAPQVSATFFANFAMGF